MKIRQFSTGATRNLDDTKPDPEGFLSPYSISAYSDYMNRNRLQADGSVRDSDNWQKGIPLSSYMKSAFRHFLEVWMYHRTGERGSKMQSALSALFFNVHGYLHEVTKAQEELSCHQSPSSSPSSKSSASGRKSSLNSSRKPQRSRSKK